MAHSSTCGCTDASNLTPVEKVEVRICLLRFLCNDHVIFVEHPVVKSIYILIKHILCKFKQFYLEQKCNFISRNTATIV